jgi:hypothetical protein
MTDRPTHKLLCATFISKFSDARRPDSNYIRCIYLPESEEIPRFVWIPYIRHENGEIDIDTHSLSITVKFRPELHLMFSILQTRLLNKVILIGQNQESGQYPESLDCIDKGRGEYFRGPLLAYGRQLVNGQYGDPTDLNLADLRELVDWYRCTYDRSTQPDILWNEQDITNQCILGVRINCISDVVVSRRTGVFESVVIDGTKVQRLPGCIPTQPALKILELDLVTWEIEPALSWHGRQVCDQSANTNRQYTWLFSTIFDESQEASEASQANVDEDSSDWISHGSFFVARLNSAPLQPQHLEALVDYLRHMVFEYQPDGESALKSYLKIISQDGFKEFWEAWAKKYREDHPNGIDFASPYEA